MAPALDAAEAEWLAQLASMRKAIQDLKLDQQSPNLSRFEKDIHLTDDDLLGGSSDDIWDITDDEYDDYSSDSLERPDEVLADDSKARAFDRDWLRAKSADFASGKSGLDASELEDQIVALLASDSRGMWSTVQDST